MLWCFKFFRSESGCVVEMLQLEFTERQL